MQNPFKVSDKKLQNDVSGVTRSISIVDFERVNSGWVTMVRPLVRICYAQRYVTNYVCVCVCVCVCVFAVVTLYWTQIGRNFYGF